MHTFAFAMLGALLPFLFTFGSAASGKFWIITDWHLDMGYAPADNATRLDPSLGSVFELCHIETSQKQLRPGVYGGFGCDSTLNLWHAALGHMRQQEPKPDFILWLGDNYGHTQPPETEANVIGSTNLLGKLIREYFPGVKVVPAVGNHDTFPYNSDPGPSFYAKICEGWESWLTDQAVHGPKNISAVTSCAAMGSFVVQVAPGVRVFSLNTQRLSTNEALPLLETALRDAESDNQTVLIAAHIPIGPSACYECSSTDGFEGDVWSQAFQLPFVRLMQRYNHTVKGIFSGHTHSDEFRVLRTLGRGDGTPKLPVMPVYIMPSLPPYNPSTNPAVRLFTFDTSIAEVITDYAQHTLLLDASNALHSDTWDVYRSMRRGIHGTCVDQ